MTESQAATTTKTGETPRKWDPAEMLTQLRADIDRIWAGLPLAERSVSLLPGSSEGWVPTVDAFDQNGMLVIKAELPGMKKEDIDVSIESGDLIVKGERSHEEEVDEEGYHRRERSYGSFYRRMPLPAGVTVDQIEATYTDGVLEVKLPKPTETSAEPVKVTVK